jgi:hypothetical protein
MVVVVKRFDFRCCEEDDYEDIKALLPISDPIVSFYIIGFEFLVI